MAAVGGRNVSCKVEACSMIDAAHITLALICLVAAWKLSGWILGSG